MGRIRIGALGTAPAWAAALLLIAYVSFGGQEPTVSDAWVAAPAEGEATTAAFAVVKNPTMYDIYLVSAVSEIAGKIEFRQTSEGEAKPVPELTVPAYGSLTMSPEGAHLFLIDLKQPLEVDESIPLVITTDGGVKLTVHAAVRAD
jgi:copper(I)-binding protein